MNFKAMYEDQRLFNQQLWKPPVQSQLTASASFMERMRTLSLGMVEETLEFLRTYEWKSHRKRKGKLQNVAHSHEELIDMFKYWMSMADASDFPIDRLEELYYAKSRVVQYRFQEEWFKELTGPCVVVDIDNVIADYIAGICDFAREWGQEILKLSTPLAARFVLRLDELEAQGLHVNASSLGITSAQWQVLKHEFRVRGGKRRLVVLPGARPFLGWCRERGWTILLVTSRPVDLYPNIFTDTMTWLYANSIPYDHLWWADDKADRLEEVQATVRAKILFAVDDDPKFIYQYRERGVKAYWLNPRATDLQRYSDPYSVRSLDEIMLKKEGEGDGLRRREA